MDPSPTNLCQSSTLWRVLDASEEELERADLVEMNLIVACGVPALANIEIRKYIEIVDKWSSDFARWLPTVEPRFHRTPQNWKNDLNFFRVGMLQGYLGTQIGIKYIEEQKDAKSVSYTNASDLFLNGVIDTLRGTCANMPTLHVAIARRMGWPVSLACAKAHCISRYDDGKVYHNIESTSTHQGSFASDPDEIYMERFGLPPRAAECGSDLRKLTAREMLGLFVSFRARHYSDINQSDLADVDFSLSRALFPTYRNGYIRAILPMLRRGDQLFNHDEMGHPSSLLRRLESVFPHSLSETSAKELR